MEIFKNIITLPNSLKLIWLSVFIQLLLLVLPYMRCVSAGGDVSRCYNATAIRSTILFLIFIPLAIYLTHIHYKKTTGVGLKLYNPFTIKRNVELGYTGFSNKQQNVAPQRNVAPKSNVAMFEEAKQF